MDSALILSIATEFPASSIYRAKFLSQIIQYSFVEKTGTAQQ